MPPKKGDPAFSWDLLYVGGTVPGAIKAATAADPRCGHELGFVSSACSLAQGATAV